MNKLDQRWLDWLNENIKRGCDPQDLYQRLLKNGFSASSVQQAMGEYYPANALDLTPEESPGQTGAVNYKRLIDVSLTRKKNVERFESDKLQLYTLKSFLSDRECDETVTLINQHLRPSTITVKGYSAYRTSSTCDLSILNDPKVKALNKKICKTLGIRPPYSEGIQGQKYLAAQEFKEHTDYFQPGTAEFKKYAAQRGQRTWTFMIYLENTKKGGGTHFVNINHTFYPEKGMAVIWNNLYADGVPNPDTLHQGMPVEDGSKTIITQWFRDKGKGPMFY